MHQGTRHLAMQRSPFLRTAALLIPVISAMLLLSQTAFAQNTYVITDGSRVLVHTTFATDPEAVLGEAGLELDEDDTYTTQRGDGVSEITVKRADAEYGETDSPEAEAVRMVETYTTSISHEVSYCYDASLEAGTQSVLTKGENGQMTCTASVVYLDGQEISRDVLTQTVTQQPVTEVIAIGTGDNAAGSDKAVIGDGIITLPTGEVLTYTDTMSVVATAYTCEGWSSPGITATGTLAREGVVAVDPSVIPYGTRFFVVSDDGEYCYGVGTAEDTGDSDFITGNRIDLYFDTEYECIQFGVRNCTIYIIGETEIVREHWGY